VTVRSVLRRFIRASDTVNGLLARLAGAALLFIVVVLVGNVVVRWVAAPISGTYELVSMAAVITFGLSVGYAQTRGAHASIDIVVKHWPRRVRIAVGAAVALACAALFAQLATSLVVYGTSQRDSGVATELLGIPTWPSVLVVAFGVVALVVALVADVAKAALAWSSEDPAVNIF
jgi:TRAP-type C4-dicarboxylate transport system permease small subunit